MATYYVRADGEVAAVDKADAALGSGGDPTDKAHCLSMTTFNAASFSAGDVVVFSHRGETFTTGCVPPTAGITLQGEDSTNLPVIEGGATFGIDFGTKDNMVLLDLDVRSDDEHGVRHGAGAGGYTLTRVRGTARKSSKNGFHLYRPEASTVLTLRDIVASGGNDGVYCDGNAANFTVYVYGGTIIGATGGDGDGMQFTAFVGALYINGPVISVNSASTKQGIICSGAGTGEIKNTHITGATSGLFFEDGTWTVSGNRLLSQSARGISGKTSATITAYGNLIINSGDYGIYGEADVTAITAKFNTVSSTRAIAQAGGTVTSEYNVLAGSADAYGGTVSSKAGDVTGSTLSAIAGSDYLVIPAYRATAMWSAGIRGLDDLPIPLNPDPGAVQDRTAPGRRFGVGGGTRR